MKNTIIKVYVTIILTMFIMFGCSEKLLEQTNPNKLTTEQFWKTAKDAESGIIGAYSPLSVVTSYGRMVNLLTTFRSDVIRPYEFSCCYNIGNFKNTANDGRMNEVWQQWWKVVFRANQVLKNVPNIEMDATTKNSILGQAYFLRAFIGFNLMNIWENVPFTTTPAKVIKDFFVNQVGPDELRPKIISDLEKAKELLPKKWPKNGIGKATSGAATALLGKLYLYNRQWPEASQEFSEVISGQHGTYDLVVKYADLFTSSTGDNSVESLFEIQLAANASELWDVDRANVDRAGIIQMDLAPPGFTNQPGARINQWAFDLFMSTKTNGGEIDPRAYSTMVWNYPGAMVYQKSWAEAVPVINGVISNIESNLDANNLVFIRKYLLFGEGLFGAVNPSRAFNNINIKIIRFADVLLMHAEAENEIGNSVSALASLNRVRKRVDMPNITVTDKDLLRNAIHNERVLELSLEGDRFQDLKRWGKLSDRFSVGDTNDLRINTALDFNSGKHERLPIPQGDIDTNSKLVQNPNY